MADNPKNAAYDYINQYQREKYDRITIIRRKGEKEKLKAISVGKGYKSTTDFINSCIDEKLKRLGLSLADEG